MKSFDKFLPIGTVVLLKKAKAKVMITGFLTSGGESQSYIYDYCGCIFPIGIYTNESTLVFNHDDIKDVYYIGYSDKKTKEFNKSLLEYEKNYVDENRKLKMSIMDIIASAGNDK